MTADRRPLLPLRPPALSGLRRLLRQVAEALLLGAASVVLVASYTIGAPVAAGAAGVSAPFTTPVDASCTTSFAGSWYGASDESTTDQGYNNTGGVGVAAAAGYTNYLQISVASTSAITPAVSTGCSGWSWYLMATNSTATDSNQLNGTYGRYYRINSGGGSGWAGTFSAVSFQLATGINGSTNVTSGATTQGSRSMRWNITNCSTSVASSTNFVTKTTATFGVFGNLLNATAGTCANLGSGDLVSITVDYTRPASSASIAAAYSTSRTVTHTVASSDATAGVNYVNFYYSAAGGTPTGSETACSGTSGTVGGATTIAASVSLACTVPADGTYYFYSRANDRAGNRENAPATFDDSIIVDTGRPITALTGPGAYATASPISFTLTDSNYTAASMDVATVTAADFTVTNGTIGVISCGTSTCTIPVTPSGQGAVSLAASGTFSVADLAGNISNVAATGTPSTTYDNVAPTAGSASISESSSALSVTGTTLFYNSATAQSTSFTVTLAPTDATAGIASVLFPSVTGLGTTPTNGPSTDTTSPYSFVYAFGTGSLTAAGSQTLTATDNAGLSSTATFTLTADSTAPTGTSLALSAGSCGSWTSATGVTVTPSGATDAGAGFLEYRYTTDGTTPTAASTLYSAPISVSSQGTTTVKVVALDNVGNTGTVVTCSVQLDNVAPTVSSFTTAVSSPTNSTSIAYTLTFSESVTGLAAGDLSNAGTLAGCSFAVAGSGASYTVTVTGCGTAGTLAPRLAANGVADAAGNAGPAAASDATPTLTIDLVAPGVSTFASADATPTNAVSATYTLVFDEPVTGLASSDLANAGTAANCTFSVTGTGASYTVTVNGCSDSGTLRPRLAANGVSDLLGNAGPSAAADASTTITIDRVAPAISWTTPVSGTTYSSSALITVVWTASDTGAGVASLRLARERVAITSAGMCAGATWTADGATADVTGESTRGVTGLVSGYCYRWALVAADAAGNTTSSTSGEWLVDTSAPSLALTATGSGVYDSGSTVYFRTGTSGTLSLSAAAADAQSGVASVTFGSLSSASGWSPTPALPNSDLLAPYAQTLTWGATAGSATMTVVAVNLAGGETSVTESFVADGAAPVATVSSPTAFVAQYATTISLAWSESDVSGVASRSIVRQVATPSAAFDCTGVSWSTDGAATSTVSPRVDTNLETGCYRFALTLVDNVGNSGTTFSAPVLVDTTPPPTPTVAETGSASFLAGSTLFFRAGALGTLTLSGASSDPTSGIASITFSGTAPSGWTVVPSLPAVDSTAPYSVKIDWTAAASGWSIGVTAENGAGAASTPASISLVADSDGPSATISSPAGAAVAASSTLSLAWTESDGTGAGVAGRSIQRERAAIPDAGSCIGASFSPDGAPTTAASPRSDTGLTSGFCYRFAITLTDQVGNSATSYSGTVLIDTTAPGAPSVTASGTGVYQSAPNGTVWFRPSATATLTLVATAADAESGIASIVFGALSVGTGWSPVAEAVDASAPYGVGYTFSGSALSTGLSVTARNGATTIGTATEISFSADAGAPVGTFSAPAGAGATSDNGTYTVAWSESDAGSGVASRSVTRERVAATGGSCPASGWETDGPPTTSASPRSDSGLASGYCVRWVLTLVDRVGNDATTTSVAVLVDSSAPDAPVVTASGTKVYQSGDLVWFGAGSGAIELAANATDAESGIASVAFGSLSSATGYTPAASLPYNPATAPYRLSLAFTAGAGSSGMGISATNGVGVASNVRSLTFVPDRTDPAASSVAPAAFGMQTSTSLTVSWSEDDAAGSGIASRSIVRQRAPISSSGSCTGASWSADGAPTAAASPRTDTGLAGGFCYRFAITLVDNVGNTSTAYTAATIVDTSTPAAPSVNAGGAGVYQAGANAAVFFRPAGASSILFTVTAVDDESGVGVIRFGALSTATGWTPSSGADVAGAPYQRSYAFSGSAATSSVAVSALNGAGAQGAVTTISLFADSAAPLVSVTAPAAAAVQAGSSITVSWTEDDDGGAGVASRSVVRYHAAIPATGSCAGATWSADGGATSTASPRVDAGLSGGCYRYGITATDRVGNGSTTVYTAAVLVDATVPDAPELALSGTSGQVYAAADGTTWFAAAGSGSITLTATAADAESGVASITFAALSGATRWAPTSSGTSGTNPAARTYAWTAGAAAATFSVSAVNGAGSSGDATSVALTPDTSAPVVTWTSPTPATTNPSGTAATLIFGVTDSGSGVASSSLQRQRAAVVSGACPDAGSFADDGPALVAPASPISVDTLLVDYCYRWVLAATDRVGQESSSMSGTIRVTSTFSLTGIPSEIDFSAGKPGDLVSAQSFSATAVAASAYAFRIEVGSMTRAGGITGDLIPASAFRFLINGSLHTPAAGTVSITSGSGTGGAGTVYAITPRVLLPFVSAGAYTGEITFVLDGLGN